MAKIDVFSAGEMVKAWAAAVITAPEPLTTNLSATGSTKDERLRCDREAAALQARVRRAPSRLSAPLWNTLSSMGAFAAAEQASEQVGGEQLRRRLMEWNDAFRTLKLIHGLRDGMTSVGE
jgi:hypothetical protein